MCGIHFSCIYSFDPDTFERKTSHIVKCPLVFSCVLTITLSSCILGRNTTEIMCSSHCTWGLCVPLLVMSALITGIRWCLLKGLFIVFNELILKLTARWTEQNTKLLKENNSPGQVAQLVRASSWHAEVVGWIPRQGTYKNQPMSASVSGTIPPCFSVSVSPSSPPACHPF